MAGKPNVRTFHIQRDGVAEVDERGWEIGYWDAQWQRTCARIAREVAAGTDNSEYARVFFVCKLCSALRQIMDK